MWISAATYKITACLLYAVLNVVMKKSALSYGVITFWENTIGALCLWGWAAWRPRDFYPSFPKSQRGWLLVQALCATGGSLLFVKSLQTWSLLQTIAMGFLNPLIAVVLAVLFLKEPLTSARIQAIALGMVAGLFITMSKSSRLSQIWGCGVWAWEPLAAHTLFSVTNIINKHLLKTASALVVTRSMMTAICVFLLLFGLVSRHSTYALHWPSVQDTWRLWDVLIKQLPTILTIGTLAVSAHWCHYQSLKRGEIVVLLPLGVVKLILSGLFGWWFFQETLTWGLVCGMIMVGLALQRLSWNFYR